MQNFSEQVSRSDSPINIKPNSKSPNNTYLIGFENGVYDLSIGKFREGLPEDNLIYNTDINYENFDDYSCLQDISTFIHQVTPNMDMKEYLEYLLKTLLPSYFDDKFTGPKFKIFTGTGSRGKTKFKPDDENPYI
jgi:phage/plasmid-associated DNA primase